jgi:hypothetical protein
LVSGVPSPSRTARDSGSCSSAASPPTA